MLQFTLSGQTYTMPDKLEELSYGSFLKYVKAGSDISRLEVLLNTDLNDLDGTPKTERQMAGVIGLMSAFDEQIKDFLTNKPMPENEIQIKILGKALRFDKDLGKLPYWALTKVKSLIKQMGKEPFNEYENYTSLVANYVYSKFETYDEYKAEQFGEDVINELPFTHVIKLGDFFLYMQHHLWMPKTDYSKLKSQQRKNRLASMFSLSMAS